MTSSMYHKTLLLSLDIIVGNLIIMGCMFLPKLYAVYYVDEEKMNLAKQTTPTNRITDASVVDPDGLVSQP